MINTVKEKRKLKTVLKVHERGNDEEDEYNSTHVKRSI